MQKHNTGSPLKDETAKTTQNSINNDLKLDFWFLHSIEYFSGLLYESSQK